MFQLSNRIRMASRGPVASIRYTPVIQRYNNTPRLFSAHARLLIKEDADRSPEELDRIKNEQVQKQKEGKGEWHEELASAGEASIAADKDKVDDHDKHIEDLQKQTAGKAEAEHPEGKA